MKILKLLALLMVVLFTVVGCNGDIDLVKDGVLELDKSRTVEEGLSANLREIEWKAFTSESDNKNYVSAIGYWNKKNNYSASLYYNDKVTINFIINKDDTFEISTIEITDSEGNRRGAATNISYYMKNFILEVLPPLSDNKKIAEQQIIGVKFNSDYTELIKFPKDSTIKNYKMLDSVRIIAPKAFADCGALESVTFSDNLNIIGAEAFANCNSLKSITLPFMTYEIGESAFYSCDSLETVRINTSGSIGNNAFTYCDSLETVYLPSSSSFEGDDIFYGSRSLRTIYISGPNTDKAYLEYPKKLNLRYLNVKFVKNNK